MIFFGFLDFLGTGNAITKHLSPLGICAKK